jgi:mRNA interferase MazF
MHRLPVFPYTDSRRKKFFRSLFFSFNHRSRGKNKDENKNTKGRKSRMMTVKRGDIYYADLSPVVGSEQGGLRPVIAAAITSRLSKNKLPTHIDISRLDTIDEDSYGLAKDSVILLEQIRTLDKQRLKEKMGHLDENHMQKVNEAIFVSFGLQTDDVPHTMG